MTQPLYTVTNVGAAGQGMIATRNIDIGTLILEEESLLVIDTQILSANWNDGNEFFNNERHQRTNLIEPRIRRPMRNAFRQLHDAFSHFVRTTTRLRYINIVATNAWSFENPNENDRN